MLPVIEPVEGSIVYCDRHRPVLITVSYSLIGRRACAADQKLFGLYLFATSTSATFESLSHGKTPVVEEGKCSDAWLEKDLSRVLTRSECFESRECDCESEAF